MKTHLIKKHNFGKLAKLACTKDPFIKGLAVNKKKFKTATNKCKKCLHIYEKTLETKHEEILK